MDHGYWNHFYDAPHPDIEAPSSFARASLPRIAAGSTVLELGCGNGRDALYFAANGRRVIACDQSEVAIEVLRARIAARPITPEPTFLCADFTRLDERFRGELDVVYSRFTLHAIKSEEATRTLRWAAESLRAGGSLLVEARTVKGSLYGKGELVERDAYVYQGHYRRFIRREELEAELESFGLAIRDVVETDGVAIYKDDDPVVVRVVAEKAK